MISVPRYDSSSLPILDSTKQLPGTQLQAAVNIEDFLRWSAEGPVKRYRRRIGKRIQSPPEEDSEQHSEYQKSSYPQEVRRGQRQGTGMVCASGKIVDVHLADADSKKYPPKPQMTKFTRRMLAAAVRAHVDLAAVSHCSQNVTNDPHTVSYLPLALESDVDAPSTTTEPRPRCCIVDPKVAAPFHDLHHSGHKATPAPAAMPMCIVRKPISQWNPVVLGPSVKLNISWLGDHVKHTLPEQRDATPFILVPLEEHEASLRARDHIAS